MAQLYTPSVVIEHDDMSYFCDHRRFMSIFSIVMHMP